MSEAPAGQCKGGLEAGRGGWGGGGGVGGGGCTAQLVPSLLPAALLLVKERKPRGEAVISLSRGKVTTVMWLECRA